MDFAAAGMNSDNFRDAGACIPSSTLEENTRK